MHAIPRGVPPLLWKPVPSAASHTPREQHTVGTQFVREAMDGSGTVVLIACMLGGRIVILFWGGEGNVCSPTKIVGLSAVLFLRIGPVGIIFYPWGGEEWE